MAKEGVAVPSSRLVAIDWLRGLVMVLMTLDHYAFDAAKVPLLA